MNVREIVRVESSRVSAQSRRCHFLWEEGTDPQQDRAFAVKNNFFSSQANGGHHRLLSLRCATQPVVKVIALLDCRVHSRVSTACVCSFTVCCCCCCSGSSKNDDLLFGRRRRRKCDAGAQREMLAQVR